MRNTVKYGEKSHYDSVSLNQKHCIKYTIY
jgi:hypothetical protein